MVDSGATTKFMNRRFVRENKVRTQKLKYPIPLYNIDGSLNKAGSISEVAVLHMKIGDHEEKVVFTVTDIGPEDVILGLDWLREHNPEIDWEQGSFKLSRCPDTCRTEPIEPQWTASATSGKRRRAKRTSKVEKGQIRAKVLPEEDSEPEVDIDWNEDELLEAWERGVTLLNSPKLYIAAGHTYSQALEEEAFLKREVKSVDQMVPEKYHDFLDIFSKEASERLPEHKSYDHAIELVPDAKTFHSKVYPLAPKEQVALDEFLKEQLAKGYIRKSKSPISSPFFFIKKKTGDLRPVQDYRRLNAITVKNRYPLPLISELTDRLRNATIFTKFDIRWGYNNIRIKAGDEWKAAFVTNRGLYEPRVMFFGLTNSPATFQNVMNDIFRDLITEGKITVYLDDILIFSTDQQEHDRVTREVLKRLKENDLFLKPEKCEWDVPETEYLGMIVGGGKVRMDPVKVSGVANWPTPTNVKGVQQFRGFANFYRRFIQDFAKITRPLDNLTKKDIPWHWGEEEQKAFDELKKCFTSTPILAIYDPSRETRIEVDASGFATGGVLSQKQDDGKWHPVAFRSHGMDSAQRNYEIYDKEMLAIIEALEDWRHYLEGLPSQFEILSDHKNLEYWRTAQHLTRRQARWALYLSRFDFVITHKAGKSNGRADALSRRVDLQVNDEDDNLDQVVLKPSQFKVAANQRGHAAVIPDTAILRRIRTCSDKDQIVAEALEKIQDLGPPRLQRDFTEWNAEQGLLLFRGCIYVPKDVTLRRDIVQMHHDAPAAGHPGRAKTLELVSRNYWWPGMTKFINDYVDTCDVCNRTKTFPAKPQGPLKPNEIPEGPWQVMTTDMIVGLPKSQGFDSILVVVDRFTKQAHFIPCHETLTAEGAAELYIRDIFRHHGVPAKVISDRGPQFASKYLQAIYKGLGIKPALSTAFHPQTDGQTERLNQEVEQYLRAFVNHRQDDWAKHLPIAEFALNNRVHSATGHSPFFMLTGYHPSAMARSGPMSTVPAAEKRLSLLEEVRRDCQASLELAAERMKRYYDRQVQEAPIFQPGDKVWLDARNLKIRQPSRKLSPKRLGPYKVIRRTGDLDYELKLPPSVPVHPVFHVSLISPYKNSPIPGRMPTEPPPIEVEGEEEYEVEHIKDSRIFRRQLQYLVKWKGYDDSHTSWEPARNVANARRLVEAFHHQHPSAPRRVSATVFEALRFKPVPEPLTSVHHRSGWELGLGATHEVMRP